LSWSHVIDSSPHLVLEVPPQQILSDCVDQLGRANSKRSGNLNNVVKGKVSLPAFNLGDVIAMNIGSIRQLFLADLAVFS
jgi:hypothetical protein